MEQKLDGIALHANLDNTNNSQQNINFLTALVTSNVFDIQIWSKLHYDVLLEKLRRILAVMINEMENSAHSEVREWSKGKDQVSILRCWYLNISI